MNQHQRAASQSLGARFPLHKSEIDWPQCIS